MANFSHPHVPFWTLDGSLSSLPKERLRLSLNRPLESVGENHAGKLRARGLRERERSEIVCKTDWNKQVSVKRQVVKKAKIIRFSSKSFKYLEFRMGRKACCSTAEWVYFHHLI